MYPDRLCGLHYFSPAEVNPVVEIVRSDRTSDSIMSAGLAFLHICRKISIECKDQSGFALNRFFCPYTHETARCIDDGLGSPAQIDGVATAQAIDLGACRAFAFAKGPVAMMHALGPETVTRLIAQVET